MKLNKQRGNKVQDLSKSSVWILVFGGKYSIFLCPAGTLVPSHSSILNINDYSVKNNGYSKGGHHIKRNLYILTSTQKIKKINKQLVMG